MLTHSHTTKESVSVLIVFYICFSAQDVIKLLCFLDFGDVPVYFCQRYFDLISVSIQLARSNFYVEELEEWN